MELRLASFPPYRGLGMDDPLGVDPLGAIEEPGTKERVGAREGKRKRERERESR